MAPDINIRAFKRSPSTRLKPKPRPKTAQPKKKPGPIGHRGHNAIEHQTTGRRPRVEDRTSTEITKTTLLPPHPPHAHDAVVARRREELRGGGVPAHRVRVAGVGALHRPQLRQGP